MIVTSTSDARGTRHGCSQSATSSSSTSDVDTHQFKQLRQFVIRIQTGSSIITIHIHIVIINSISVTTMTHAHRHALIIVSTIHHLPSILGALVVALIITHPTGIATHLTQIIQFQLLVLHTLHDPRYSRVFGGRGVTLLSHS